MTRLGSRITPQPSPLFGLDDVIVAERPGAGPTPPMSPKKKGTGLPATTAHVLTTLAEGGTLKGARYYPGPWRYQLVYPEPALGSKRKVDKDISEGTVADMAGRLYILGEFQDGGHNTHLMVFALGAAGRAVLTLYESDPRVAARLKKKARGAA